MIKKLLYGSMLMLLVPGVAQAMETKATVAAASESRSAQAAALNADLKSMSLIDHVFYSSEAYPAFDAELTTARAANLENRIIVIMLDAIWRLVHEGTLLEWRNEDNIHQLKAQGLTWDLQDNYEKQIISLLAKFLVDVKLDEKTSKRMVRCTFAASKAYALRKLKGEKPDILERYQMAQPLIALHRALYAEYEKRYLSHLSEEDLLKTTVVMNRFDESFAKLEVPVFDDSLNVPIDAEMTELREIIYQKLPKATKDMLLFPWDSGLI